MRQVNIRPARLEDAEAMAAMTADLRGWFTPDCPEEVRADCARFAGLVAVGGSGGVVGFLIYAYREKECEIKWLGVRRELHRRGIGRRLMNRLLDIARESGAARVSVETLAHTMDYAPYVGTRAFYEACGFVLESLEKAGWPDGSDKAVYVRERVGCG